MNPMSVLAAENQRLKSEVRELAELLMSPLVFVHEHLIDRVDAALKPHLGGSDDRGE